MLIFLFLWLWVFFFFLIIIVSCRFFFIHSLNKYILRLILSKMCAWWKKRTKQSLYSLGHFFFFFCTCGMWKFLGQRPNLCHSNDLSGLSDNTGSLTCCATGEVQSLCAHETYSIIEKEKLTEKSNGIITLINVLFQSEIQFLSNGNNNWEGVMKKFNKDRNRKEGFSEEILFKLNFCKYFSQSLTVLNMYGISSQNHI